MKLLGEGFVIKLENIRTHHLPAPQKANSHPQCWFHVYILSIPIHKCNEIHVNKIKKRKWQFKYKKPFLCVCFLLFLLMNVKTILFLLKAVISLAT